MYHKRTFLFLEQLILKHDAAAQCVKVGKWESGKEGGNIGDWGGAGAVRACVYGMHVWVVGGTSGTGCTVGGVDRFIQHVGRRG